MQKSSSTTRSLAVTGSDASVSAFITGVFIRLRLLNESPDDEIMAMSQTLEPRSACPAAIMEGRGGDARSLEFSVRRHPCCPGGATSLTRANPTAAS